MSDVNGEEPIENGYDIFYLLFLKRYDTSYFNRSFITDYFPWFNGWVTIWLQLILLIPLIYFVNQILSSIQREWFAAFTYWTVWITFFYLLSSIWANLFSWVPYLDMKWIPTHLGSVAMCVTTLAFTVSWTFLHPMAWIELGFST